MSTISRIEGTLCDSGLTTERTSLLQNCSEIAGRPVSFSYDNVPLSPNTIRLVRVLPNTHEGRLQCALKVARTDAGYTAVSYQWGTGVAEKEIWLNGNTFAVRRNLWDLLRVVRCNYSCWLWIDAICINQADLAERHEIVRGMAHIYSSAALNLSWLGECCSNVPTRRVMPQEVETVIDLIDVDAATQEFLAAIEVAEWTEGTSASFPRPIKCGEFFRVFWLFEHLCTHRYWTRMWIIQEVLLSKRKVLLFANLRVSWTVFVKMLSLIITDLKTRRWSFLYIGCERGCRRNLEAVVHRMTRHCLDNITAHDLGYVSRLSMSANLSAHLLRIIRPGKLIALEMIRLRDIILTKPAILLLLDDQKLPLGAEWFLEDRAENFGLWMSNLRDCECSDRRDRLYSLLGLAANPNGILVDYAIGIYDLFYIACRAMARGSLDTKPDPRDRLLSLINNPHSDILRKRATRRLRNRLKESVVNLMEHLRLGPLDLLFGDDRQRAQAKLVTRDDRSEILLSTSTMLRSAFVSTWPDTLSGICDVCGELVHYHLKTLFSARYVLLQCHAQQSVLSQHVHVRSPDEESHILLYQFEEYGGWVRLYQPLLSSDPSLDYEMFRDQLTRRWKPPPSILARTNIRLFMPAMIGLHQAWHEGDLGLHTRLHSLFKTGHLKLNPEVVNRRRLGNLSSFRALFNTEPGSRKRAIRSSMIKSLLLEENAQKTLILRLEQEGYQVGHNGSITRRFGCCSAR